MSHLVKRLMRPLWPPSTEASRVKTDPDASDLSAPSSPASTSAAPSSPPASPPSVFFAVLPRELRDIIYAQVLTDSRQSLGALRGASRDFYNDVTPFYWTTYVARIGVWEPRDADAPLTIEEVWRLSNRGRSERTGATKKKVRAMPLEARRFVRRIQVFESPTRGPSDSLVPNHQRCELCGSLTCGYHSCKEWMNQHKRTVQWIYENMEAVQAVEYCIAPENMSRMSKTGPKFLMDEIFGPNSKIPFLKLMICIKPVDIQYLRELQWASTLTDAIQQGSPIKEVELYVDQRIFYRLAGSNDVQRLFDDAWTAAQVDYFFEVYARLKLVDGLQSVRVFSSGARMPRRFTSNRSAAWLRHPLSLCRDYGSSHYVRHSFRSRNLHYRFIYDDFPF